MRKMVYKASELFNEVLKVLKENGDYDKAREIIDYTSAASYDDFLITNNDFTVDFNVDYGSSEGIYADFYLNGYIINSETMDRRRIGCIKSLCDDKENFIKMASLAAAFKVEAEDFVCENHMDFIDRGFFVQSIHTETGNNAGGFYESKKSLSELIDYCKKKMVSNNRKWIYRIYDLAERREVSYE